MHPALKVAMVSAALLAGFFGPQLLEQVNQALDTQTEQDISKYCMLSTQECAQDSVTMVFEHDSAQPLVPATLTVTWDGTSSDQLQLSLSGLEMEMGTARFQLKRTEGNTFQGDVILPVCTMDKMTWLGELTDGNNTVHPAIRMER